ncbi:MAG: hypothetical protein WEB00_11415 [Dehalococcoidia bacterium]
MTDTNSRIPVTVRLAPELRAELERLAEEDGRNLSAVVNELLFEGARMRRVPGIVFGKEPEGRRPWVVGTGMEVWEVVDIYRGCDCDIEKVKASYPLSGYQVQTALAYYQAFPDEIDRRFEEDRRFFEGGGVEEFYRRFPQMKPKDAAPSA